MHSADDILKSFNKANVKRKNWEALWQDCYDYSLPQREDFYHSNAQQNKGENRMEKIFDETALNALPEFASRMLSGLVPPFDKFIKLRAGQFVSSADREAVNNGLSRVGEALEIYLKNSNFNQEIYEAILEVAVGTGTILFEEGTRANKPFKFTAVPLTRLWLEKDAFDRVGKVFYRPHTCARDLSARYADLPKEAADLAEKEPDKEVEVIDCTYWDEAREEEDVYIRKVMLKDTMEILMEEEYVGEGSNPWIVFRWSKSAGEVYGRGPLLQVLPAIKTANLVKQLLLENADITVTGIWQAEDDGVLNPDTVLLEPGAIIPKAPGSRGLEALQSASNPDLSQFILGDMQFNIRKGLYNEQLGRPDKTPMTATEVAERMADLSRQIGAPISRILAEGMRPLIRRALYILRKQGYIDQIMIGEDAVEIQFESPLAQAQRFERIANRQRFIADAQGMFGPEITLLLTKPLEYLRNQARDYDIEEDSLNTLAEARKVQKQIQAAAQQTLAAQGGQPGSAEQS